MENCSVCGKKLSGVSKGAKTLTKPTRILGGILCHSCVERTVKLKSRLEDKAITPDQIDVEYKKYVEQIHIKTEEKPKREIKKRAKKKK